MPNKRHDDRKKLSAWLWKEEIELLKAYAKVNNQTVTDVLTEFIRNLPKKLGK